MGTVQTRREASICTRAGGRIACSEGNRHQPGPLLAYTLSERDPDREGAESPSFVTTVRWTDNAGPRSRNTRERQNGHDHITHHRLRGAAARRRRILLPSQGLTRMGGYARTPVPPILAGSATEHVVSLRSRYRSTARSVGTYSFVTRNRESFRRCHLYAGGLP